MFRATLMENLIDSDIYEFDKLWDQNIVSWADEIKFRSKTLIKNDGSLTPAAFDLIDDITKLQNTCIEAIIKNTNKRIKNMINDTENILPSQCSKELAKNIDYNMYKINNVYKKNT